MMRCKRPPWYIMEVLQVAHATRAQEGRANLGPVRYLGDAARWGDQDVPRWFILVVAIFDPAAALLLLAATRR